MEKGYIPYENVLGNLPEFWAFEVRKTWVSVGNCQSGVWFMEKLYHNKKAI